MNLLSISLFTLAFTNCHVYAKTFFNVKRFKMPLIVKDVAYLMTVCQNGPRFTHKVKVIPVEIKTPSKTNCLEVYEANIGLNYPNYRLKHCFKRQLYFKRTIVKPITKIFNYERNLSTLNEMSILASSKARCQTCLTSVNKSKYQRINREFPQASSRKWFVALFILPVKVEEEYCHSHWLITILKIF